MWLAGWPWLWQYLLLEMAIVGRQMTTTTISSMGVLDCMDCDLCAGGMHHIHSHICTNTKLYIFPIKGYWPIKVTFIPLWFSMRWVVAFVQKMNIVWLAKHSTQDSWQGEMQITPELTNHWYHVLCV